MALNTLAVTPDTQIVLTVRCEAPEDNKNIRLRADINDSYYCEWICTLTNQSPMLEISLLWSTGEGCEPYNPPPIGVRALRIVSRHGQHLFFARIDGVKDGVPLTGMRNLFLCNSLNDTLDWS